MDTFTSWNSFLQYNAEKFNGEGGEPIEFNVDEVSQFNSTLVEKYKDKLVSLSNKFLKPSFYFKDKAAHVFGNVRLKDGFSEVHTDSHLVSLGHFEISENNNVNVVNLNKVSHAKCLCLNWSSVEKFHANELKYADVISFVKSKVKDVHFQKLSHVGSFYMCDVTGDSDIHIDSFSSVDRLHINGCDSFNKVEFKLLCKAESVNVSNNEGVREVCLPSLAYAKKVTICDNPSLTTLDLSKLEKVKQLVICRNPSLKHIKLPSLSCATKVYVSSCQSLTHLEFPRLTHVAKGVFVNKCRQVTDVDLSELQRCKYFVMLNMDSFNNTSCTNNLLDNHMYLVDGKLKCC